MNNEKIVKIVRPERIMRILGRVCAARLDVLVRTPANKKIAVRAKVLSSEPHASPPNLLLSGLSDQGVKYLWNADVVQVDFVGMATQMIFKVRVLAVDHDTIRLSFPKMLVSYDRRENARFNTTEQLSAFTEIGIWEPRLNDIGAPPVFAPFENLSSWVQIADLSEGGFCGVARYPTVLEAYQRGVIDRKAKIIFPMQPPIDSPVEIRWTRKIRESHTINGETFSQRIYKFGAQFINPSDDVIRNLKQFIHQISLSDAI